MSDEAVKLARAIETAQCVCDSEEYDSDDLLRLRDVTPMLLEEMAKLRADNDVLRTQVEYRTEPLGLDDWARQLLDKYTGYPHVNADPFDSLDMGQRAGARPCPIGGKAVEYRATRERGHGNANAGGAPHPTTKPQSLMRELVEHYSLPGDTILDCFTGSGSTGIAALALGRRFVGFELSPEYHAIACRRLRGDEAKPRPEQPSLFDAIGAAR